jgi:hypothetical protein
MGGPGTTDRLESWKEIAAYLNRSVRTVRRWEAAEGLPVHRQMHRTLGSVYAFKSELDAWRQPHPLRRSEPPSGAASEVMSIAVLPFVNLSPGPENEYFADGLTDEVIANLSKVRALRVISRTSSMALKGTNKDVKTIGRELGVRFVVEGSVRRFAKPRIAPERCSRWTRGPLREYSCVAGFIIRTAGSSKPSAI